MTGLDVTVAVDPKVRIQGLLETANRYLERARIAEAAVTAMRNETAGNLVILSAIRYLIEGMQDLCKGQDRLSGDALMALKIGIDEIADSMRHVPLPFAED